MRETGKVLVVGASGATGRLVVERLLGAGVEVSAVVRAADRLPESVRNHPGLSLKVGSLLEFPDTELQGLVEDCDAVISCLGHNLTFKGMFGSPRRLVTDATRRLCEAVRCNASATPVRFILMNSSGCKDPTVGEVQPWAERCVIALIRALVPPHRDNEEAAAFLREAIGTGDPFVEWVILRPDSLIDANDLSPYELVRSPTRSPIFNSGKSSRINVADCMTRLAREEALWREWSGRSPVLYNRS
ncbi:MAG: NAD(P)-dependent oxidoreductase [Puniceicoccales bacterium]